MARNFNGTTDRIDLSSPASLPGSQPVSISAMVYLTTTGAGLKTIINYTGSGKEIYLRAGFAATDKPEFGYWDGSSDHRAVDGSALSGNTWYSLVGTYDGSTYSIYVNGGGPATTSDATGPSFTPTDASIGYQPPSNARPWPGNIAELGIWSACLTAAEAASLSKGYSPKLIRPSSLNTYFPLLGRISPEIDLRGQTGTLTGTANADHPRVIYPKRKAA